MNQMQRKKRRLAGFTRSEDELGLKLGHDLNNLNKMFMSPLWYFYKMFVSLYWEGEDNV